MNSQHIGADLVYAWPTAEIAVMGAKGAAEIIFKREIAASDDPEATWKEKEAEYAELFAHPVSFAYAGWPQDSQAMVGSDVFFRGAAKRRAFGAAG